ncbi:MAG: molybdenum ABC transporter ATP-binding protein [Gemmatimonadetes bacterium]|nr:molybdenum ABC transporter ATP-binding protein [Gemmatimonadota bacterium]
MSALTARLWRDSAPRLDADVTIDAGITALFGPSGAGKTTLLHALAGLVRPERGRIERAGTLLFDSERGVNEPPERRRIGVVFQEPRLFPHRSVRENLRYGAPRADVPRDFDRAVSLLELDGLLERRPASLSGGEQRRVAIARTLLADPAVMLLDEPLTGLDGARKDRALQLLSDVHREFGLPLVLVSHSLPDILRLTTRIVVLEGGRTIAAGELLDVLDSDEVFRLADSLGLESHLEVEVLGTEGGLTRARVGGTELELPPIDVAPGTRALVAVRPEDVILAAGPVLGTSARNCLEGRVSRVARLSDRLLVTIDVGGSLRASISAKSGEALGIREGATIWCLVKAFSFRWRRVPGESRLEAPDRAGD